MLSEEEIRKEIKDLNTELNFLESKYAQIEEGIRDDSYPRVIAISDKKRLLMTAYGVENKLYALHLVLGEEYKFRH